MLGQEFMRNALIAGSFVGIACGLAGWFLVLRAQVFAGDALGHFAFAGALAAAVAGVDLRLGLFAATIAGALAIGALGERTRPDDVVIGALFVWILGLGVLFLSIFTVRKSGGGDGAAGVRVLFGSIFGLAASDVWLAALVGAGASLALLAIARPLLFGSLAPAVAAARGVPVRLLGLVFLGITGLVAAETSRAVGALLLLGLLAAPAGAAHRLTHRPYLGLALSALLALGSVWLGLALAYVIPRLPPSSAMILVAVGAYVVASATALVPRRARGVARQGART